MASLEGMSDSELRRKLTEYGCAVGPVTETTRKTLLKKLKHLMEQSGRAGAEMSPGKSRRSLSRFSSGEDSETDDVKTLHANNTMPPPNSPLRSPRRKSTGKITEPVNSVATKPRRSEINLRSDLFTSANSIIPGRSSTPSTPGETSSKTRSGRYSLNKLDSPSNSGSSYLLNNSSAGRRTTRTLISSSSNVDEFETGSDSDVPDVKTDRVKRRSTGQLGVVNTDNSDRTSAYASSFLNRLSSVRSRFLSDNSKNSDSGRETNSSSSVDTLMAYRKGLVTGGEKKTKLAAVPTQFQSNFTRRLSMQSRNSNTFGRPSTYSTPSSIFDVKENDVSDDDAPTSVAPNGLYNTTSPGHLASRIGSLTSTRSRDISQEFKTTEDEVPIWHNSHMVSMVLLAVLLLFFAVLAAMYLSVRSHEGITFAPGDKDNSFPPCKTDETGECIDHLEVARAVSALNKLHPELHARAVQLHCGGDNGGPMTEGQALDWLRKHDPDVSLRTMFNVTALLKANPQWGVKVSKGALEVVDPELPLLCVLRLRLKQLVFYVLMVIAIAGLGWGMLRGYTWNKARRQKAQRDVYALVDRILELLAAHHATAPPGQGYLAINHVRDQLISPPDRQQMAATWAAAVRFLEQNESRVRCEVQTVAGEECPVWRWLAPEPGRRPKVWQGQAFETMAGSPNSLPCSPTPCLKVRHMFDPDVEYGDDWVERVRDAILEKCEGAAVLHVAVERTSREGCVYVKCASQEDAGRAYRALHGWWFDSHLVTVKYLRLERYHERFPGALHARSPLNPSNNQKLSLQALLHPEPGD